MIIPSFAGKHLYQYYKNEEMKEHRLLYLFFEITRKCNLSCLHCGSDCISSPNTPELTAESWIKIIQYIKSHFSPPPVIVITGGEPLVHPGLEKIVCEIQNQNMRWGMVTNGQLLDQKKWNSLLKLGIESITVSLDGPEEAHDYLRNKRGAYEKAVRSIQIIGQSSIPYKDAVTCVFPRNLDLLKEIAETLIQNKMNSWRLFRIFPIGRAAQQPEIILNHRQSWSMIDWIKNHKKKLKRRGLDLNLSCEGYLPYLIDKQVRNQPFFCRSGINIASILCDGTITGCSNNSSLFYTGNILKDNFSDIWENGFQKLRHREWTLNRICKNCPEQKFCQGNSMHLYTEKRNFPLFCYMNNEFGKM